MRVKFPQIKINYVSVSYTYSRFEYKTFPTMIFMEKIVAQSNCDLSFEFRKIYSDTALFYPRKHNRIYIRYPLKQKHANLISNSTTQTFYLLKNIYINHQQFPPKNVDCIDFNHNTKLANSRLMLMLVLHKFEREICGPLNFD